MRIPKGILKIASVCSKERDTMRYAFHGLMLRRKKDRLQATATDGRRLIDVRWKDQQTDPLPGLEEVEKPVDDYRVIVPAAVAKRADAVLPRRWPKKSKGGLHGVIVDEPSTNGAVRLITSVEGVTSSIQAEVVQGTFPDHEGVIPKTEIFREAWPAADKKTGKRSGKAVRIAVDGNLLSELLQSVSDAAPSRDGRVRVFLEIPTDPTVPMKVTRQADDVEVTAVLMPMNPD